MRFITLSEELTENLDFHNENIRLGSVNLEKFNNLFSNYVCNVLYDVKTSQFMSTDSPNKHSEFIVWQINKFLWWSNTYIDKSEYVERYLKTCHSDFEELFASVQNHKQTVMSKDSLISRYKKDSELLFLHYFNFYPLDFLNYEDVEKIKNTLNSYCAEINVYLNEISR